jgi:hypothetical protein
MAAAESVVRPNEVLAVERVTLGTWLRFLFGSRDAILRIAHSPQALWLGLLFVLSTGFAREYDGADLRSEPWHLAIPLVASLATSLILWALVYVAASGHGVEQRFWTGYRTLLTFYWMTAPLAWIYAIPVERYLPPGDATATNFYFLALVSLWRVLLITRALSIWLSANFFAMFFLVALFADTVAGILAFASPMPIFDVMGGIRHSQVDNVVLGALMNMRVFGVISWPVWLIGAIAVLTMKSPWSLSDDRTHSHRVTASLWAFASLLLVAGGAILPFGQAQQQHASEAAKLLRANELATAVKYLSALDRTELPPIWDPPPRTGYGESQPPVLDVLDEIAQRDGPGWLANTYVEKLSIDPSSRFWSAIPRDETTTADEARFERLLSTFEKHVPVTSIDRWEQQELLGLTHIDSIDSKLRDRLRAYLKPDGETDEQANSSD